MKPGQFVNVNGLLCRAKRATYKCNGCLFDTPFTCPGQHMMSKQGYPFACIVEQIIFEKP